MNTVEGHYEQLLAHVYTWMAGGSGQKVEGDRRFFIESGVTPKGCGRALDLDCGSGFQSLALAALGFRVVAVDTRRRATRRSAGQRRDGPGGCRSRRHA